MYKKKVLVFGSRGLVGKNLIKKLKKTHDVIEVLNPNSNNDNIISKENILYVDLFQQIDTSILENKIESIIYLSQPSKNVYRNGLIDKIYNINTLNPYNIALFAIKIKLKILYISQLVEFIHSPKLLIKSVIKLMLIIETFMFLQK